MANAKFWRAMIAYLERDVIVRRMRWHCRECKFGYPNHHPDCSIATLLEACKEELKWAEMGWLFDPPKKQ